MSNAKYDPTNVAAQWGPIILTGFAPGAYITAQMFAPTRYQRTSARGRSVHTLVTDKGGQVMMRFQGDSPSLALIMAQILIDEAPGGNVVFPLIIKDLNGLDSVVSPVARCVSIPNLEHTDGEANPREFEWWCEPLFIYHGGIASING